MKVRAHAALSAKGQLAPFDYDLGPLGPQQVDVRVTPTLANSVPAT